MTNIAFATMEKIENRPENTVGSSRIRARWLIKYWPEASEYQVGRDYDVMIFQKCYWHEMMLKFEGIKVFDLCDPDWLEPRPVVESIELCDAAVTSTPALADYLKKFVKNKPIICIPDRIDLEEHSVQKKFHRDVPKSVVWFGYGQNQHYLIKTLDFLIERNLELTVISNKAFDLPHGFQNVKLNNIIYNYSTLNEELIKHDMALLPPTEKDDLKGIFKSNNKVLNAWALGLPVVQEPDDFEKLWTKAARIEEAAKHLVEVETSWDVKKSVEEYKELIAKIGGDKNGSK